MDSFQTYAFQTLILPHTVDRVVYGAVGNLNTLRKIALVSKQWLKWVYDPQTGPFFLLGQEIEKIKKSYSSCIIGRLNSTLKDVVKDIFALYQNDQPSISTIASLPNYKSLLPYSCLYDLNGTPLLYHAVKQALADISRLPLIDECLKRGSHANETGLLLSSYPYREMAVISAVLRDPCKNAEQVAQHLISQGADLHTPLGSNQKTAFEEVSEGGFYFDASFWDQHIAPTLQDPSRRRNCIGKIINQSLPFLQFFYPFQSEDVVFPNEEGQYLVELFDRSDSQKEVLEAILATAPLEKYYTHKLSTHLEDYLSNPHGNFANGNRKLWIAQTMFAQVCDKTFLKQQAGHYLKLLTESCHTFACLHLFDNAYPYQFNPNAIKEALTIYMEWFTWLVSYLEISPQELTDLFKEKCGQNSTRLHEIAAITPGIIEELIKKHYIEESLLLLQDNLQNTVLDKANQCRQAFECAIACCDLDVQKVAQLLKMGILPIQAPRGNSSILHLLLHWLGTKKHPIYHYYNYDQARQNNLAIFQQLVLYFNPNVIDNHGMTPLAHAVSYGFLEFAIILIDAGAIVDELTLKESKRHHDHSPLKKYIRLNLR